ncbi:unnamed protein product [Rhizoctonia solani]|uniref:Uncharacterized protein n=1 Tax=Rhizoctonia solani TaxID=456999 RepID=A0A8H3CGA5_9AGAM|nr:unnamed protein product [Rhizoctonia solani]
MLTNSNARPTVTLGKRNPLLIPEVACMVLNFVSASRDGCNLAKVCRLLFQSLIPRLWRTVRSIEQLLGLIPGAVVTQKRTKTNSNKITVRIPELALDKPWERYWIYSPHVRTLRMLASKDVIHVHGWNVLFAKREGFEGSLLPNLESLVTDQPTTGFNPVDYLALFALFLSPSIKNLGFADYLASYRPRFGPEFHSLSAMLLINNLAASRGIALPSHYNRPVRLIIARSGLGLYKGCPGWLESTPVLTNLTWLNIHISAVLVGSGEGLVVLGHLPRLDDLALVGTLGSNSHSGSISQGELIPIPSGLFPSLRILRLEKMSSTRIFYHIWNSDTMVSKLEMATIRFDYKFCPVARNEIECQVIPLLNSKSPNLKVVGLATTIKTDGSNNTEVSRLELLPTLLSRLSVSALSLNICPGSGQNQNTSLAYSLPNRVFPLLIHLDAFIPLSCCELRALAALLPNLKHISVLLSSEEFEYADMGNEPVSLQPILVHIRHIKHRHLGESGAKYLEENRPQITRFIKSIWPNLSYLDIGDKECIHVYRAFSIIRL